MRAKRVKAAARDAHTHGCMVRAMGCLCFCVQERKVWAWTEKKWHSWCPKQVETALQTERRPAGRVRRQSSCRGVPGAGCTSLGEKLQAEESQAAGKEGVSGAWENRRAAEGCQSQSVSELFLPIASGSKGLSADDTMGAGYQPLPGATLLWQRESTSVPTPLPPPLWCWTVKWGTMLEGGGCSCCLAVGAL